MDVFLTALYKLSTLKNGGDSLTSLLTYSFRLQKLYLHIYNLVKLAAWAQLPYLAILNRGVLWVSVRVNVSVCVQESEEK